MTYFYLPFSREKTRQNNWFWIITAISEICLIKALVRLLSFYLLVINTVYFMLYLISFLSWSLRFIMLRYVPYLSNAYSVLDSSSGFCGTVLGFKKKNSIPHIHAESLGGQSNLLPNNMSIAMTSPDRQQRGTVGLLSLWHPSEHQCFSIGEHRRSPMLFKGLVRNTTDH